MNEVVVHWHYTRDNKHFYLCNQAVTPNLEKVTDTEKYVTCKNCKKILGLEG